VELNSFNLPFSKCRVAENQAERIPTTLVAAGGDETVIVPGRGPDLETSDIGMTESEIGDTATAVMRGGVGGQGHEVAVGNDIATHPAETTEPHTILQAIMATHPLNPAHTGSLPRRILLRHSQRGSHAVFQLK